MTTPPIVRPGPDPVERTTGFGTLDIRWDARVLEPRVWTTAQSEWAAELLRQCPPGPVLELCAGAGHIGLLTVSLEPRPLVCVDLDPVACSYAERNAESADLREQVTVRQGRLEEVVPAHERYALVVADPPWVPEAEVGRFPEDPLLAIDGGPDGLVVARACLQVVADHLLPGGWAVLQVGTAAQADGLAAQVSQTYDDLEPAGVRVLPRGTLLALRRPG